MQLGKAKSALGRDAVNEVPATGGAVPEVHHVHHSYIWLGSLRSAGAIFVALAITQISTFVSIFAGEFEEMPIQGASLALVTVGIMAALVLIIAAVIAVVHVVSYKHLYFTLTDEEFTLYRGVISKKREHIPYRRIQSVDQRTSLLQRVFGVCSVMLDTAGGAANKQTVIPYVTKQQAEWLRVELFARKNRELHAEAERARAAPGATPGAVPTPGQPLPGAASHNILDAGESIWHEIGGVFAGDAVDTGHVSYEHGLTNKELVFAGMSNNTAFAIILLGILAALGQVIGFFFEVLPDQSASLAGDIAAQAGSELFGRFALMGALAVLGSAVGLWVLSIVASCLNFGGFHARRRGGRIEVEHGLLQHNLQGIDIDRVQSVIVSQTFIRRLMGYCEVSLGKIEASREGEGSSGKTAASPRLIVHPFVKLDQVPQILAGIIPEYEDVPRQITPVPPVSLRRALIRRCLWQGAGFWLAVCTACVQVPLNLVGARGLAQAAAAPVPEAAAFLSQTNTIACALYVLALVLTALAAVGAVLWHRESGFAYNRCFMQITTGGFSRNTVSFPRQKIQYGVVRSNPFQRAARVATISARTAAGIGGTSVRLLDVREEDAAAWLAWTRPHGNVVE